MRTRVSARSGRLLIRVLSGLAILAVGASPARAQTTVTLDDPAIHVLSATIRGGTYADTSLPELLATRSADNLQYRRRALIKFDTHHTIPADSVITSAIMTITVKLGGADATRTVGAYQVRTPWTETEVTWNARRNSSPWISAGGDLGRKIAEAVVGNEPGTTVSFDVTPLVKAAVAGELGSSRYTRIALVDVDSSTRASYREYYTPSEPDASRRPALKVTYTAPRTESAPTTKTPPKAPPTPTTSPTPTTPPTPTPTTPPRPTTPPPTTPPRPTTPPPTTPPRPTTPPPPPPTSAGDATSTLRVLQWNTHHGGVGSDGKWDPYRLTRWIAKIDADIVSLNEVERYTGWGNTDEPALIASLLEQYTGRTWHYKFTTAGGGPRGNGNMVLSRFPFASTDVELLSHTRSAVAALVYVNGRIVNVTSTHLDADSKSKRLRQINDLMAWQNTLAGQRIVCGDFNAWPGAAENAKMKEKFHDSWAVAQANNTDLAFPGDEAGNTRHSRIDYIYYSNGAGALVLKASEVFDTRDAHGVRPSDHRPVMATFLVR